MATIKPKNLTNGRRAFQVRWYAPDGRERSKQFARHADAKSFKSELESALVRGAYVDPRAGKITFREYAEKWRANQVHYRETSARNVERALRLHLYPYIGDKSLGSLRRSDIQAIVGKWPVRSAANYMQVLTVVLNAAVLDEVIVKSPAVSIQLPEVDEHDMIIPTIDQVRSIAQGMGNWSAMITLAASTGMRRSELLAMTLESVDLDERTVRVRPDKGQVVFPTGMPGRLGPPKTRASARTIPIGNVAADTIRARLAAFPPDPADGFGGALFTGRTGLIHGNSVGAKLQPIMEAHGFPPNTGIHVFRHFYASALITAGESVKVVQKRLGHTSAVETLDTYGHLWPDSDEASRTAIDDAFTD